MEKCLLIRTRNKDKYKQLGWWNIDKIPDLTGLKYIFAHDGNGNVTGAYKIKDIAWKDDKKEVWSEIILPYAVSLEKIHKKDKDGKDVFYIQQRVNFTEYTDDCPDLFNVVIPKQKKGQGNPLYLVNFDLQTKIISQFKY